MCAIHSFNEGGYIVWLQERGDFHAHVRACGGVSASSGRRGGAGRGDRVVHSPVGAVHHQGGQRITAYVSMELPNIAAYAYQDVHVWSALLTCLRPHFQGSQPMPSHCLPDAECQPQRHL